MNQGATPSVPGRQCGAGEARSTTAPANGRFLKQRKFQGPQVTLRIGDVESARGIEGDVLRVGKARRSVAAVGATRRAGLSGQGGDQPNRG